MRTPVRIAEIFALVLTGVAVSTVGRAGEDTPKSLVYSTYIGGSGTDFFNFLAVNAAGEAVVTGESASTDYPTTPGTPQRSLNGIRDAVVTKVSTDGSSLVYSTYFGGSGFTESGLGVAYDASGNAWAVGETNSTNLPVMGAFQPSLGNSGASQFTDGFLVELTPTGSLAFASYFGGDGRDELFGVAPDATGIYVIGSSQSTLVPGQSSARDVSAKAQAAVVDARSRHRLERIEGLPVYERRLADTGAERAVRPLLCDAAARQRRCARGAEVRDDSRRQRDGAFPRSRIRRQRRRVSHDGDGQHVPADQRRAGIENDRRGAGARRAAGPLDRLPVRRSTNRGLTWRRRTAPPSCAAASPGRRQ